MSNLIAVDFEYCEDMPMAVNVLSDAGSYFWKKRDDANPHCMRMVKVLQEHKLITTQKGILAKKFRDTKRQFESQSYTLIRAIEPEAWERIKNSEVVWWWARKHGAPTFATCYERPIGGIGAIRVLEWTFENPKEEAIMVLEKAGRWGWRAAA